MTVLELIKLSKSNEAPFNHEDFVVWLHNTIVLSIRNDIHLHRAAGYISEETKTNILTLPSLKTV